MPATELEYNFEQDLRLQGFKLICGVDEAGRGPLAGPVCAAAVILPEDCDIIGLNDSKKLTAAKREFLSAEIKSKAVAYSISTVGPEVIDRINILQATFVAMSEAVEALVPKSDFALIDGNKVPPQLTVLAKCIIGGDGKSPSIAAASILAKVERDRIMTELAKNYPLYSFEKHKGYGTAAHVAAIKAHGMIEIHRKTFLKKIL